MKIDFLKLTPKERHLYIEQGAIQKNVSPVIMEKDFWVCWLLNILFESEFADGLVFKGGTSLSKVFGAINRFSEDIDLSLSPNFLKLSEGEITSRTQGAKWMKSAEAVCEIAVRTQIMPTLEASVLDILGNDRMRFEFLKDPNSNSPVLLFHYPSLQPTGFDYIKRSVKLEFGSLTDQQPTGRHTVMPWIAEIFPKAFPDWRCEVVALEIERTFWEKATILHAEYYRQPEKPIPDRYSRHYADMSMLAKHHEAIKAVDNHSLRNQVVLWKSQFFGSSWANYDFAKPGTFHLVPQAERLPALRRDYQLMRDMYLTEPVSFANILGILTDLEHRINKPLGEKQMIKYICEKLSLNLSSARNQSPNLKALAKSKYNKAATTTGNNSPILMPEGDINIINAYPPVRAVDDHKTWEELLQCFSDRTINLIIDNYIKNHRIGKDLESAFGWQKYIIGKFDKVQIFQNDIRAKAFVNIKANSKEALNSFMHSKNCEQFKQAWVSFRDELNYVRDSKSD